jgi:uncharacterized damage-inducible protein DinB
MEVKEILIHTLEHSQRYINTTLDGLTQEEFGWSPNAECNSIAFIFWHIARVEDIIMNTIVQSGKEIYDTEGWQKKLGTPAKDIGYHYTLEQLHAWPVPKLEVLQKYANAVRKKTLALIKSMPAEKLSEMPKNDLLPGSIGHILSFMGIEIALHAGQMAYLRGMQRGMDK